MKFLRYTALPVFLATLWISISEFVRNEFLLATHWTDHYASMGLEFPGEPVNGAVWGLWSLVFAIFIFLIHRKFSLWRTVLIAWIAGFVMMWLVTGNMGVLPYRILVFAIPLSLLEVLLAVFIIRKLAGETNERATG